MDKGFIKILALSVCFTATLILLGNFYTYLLSSACTKITFNEIYPFTIVSLFTGGVLGCFFILIVPILLEDENKDDNGDDNNHDED